MEQKLYSIEDLVPILKLHSKTILRFIHEGKIRARKVGRTWMVQQDALDYYLQGDSVEPKSETHKPEDVARRITVSAVIEIEEQNSDEATRLSNSLLALLNSKDDSFGKSRFDFFYYPEIQKAKYVLYGSPKFISLILETFHVLSRGQEEPL